ncbi:MAG: sigma-70 family RNA polymerase sigma factor [Planctomycetota bacterium]
MLAWLVFMNFAETTRASLVNRLRDHDDTEAWSEFVDIYGPVIYRYGRHRGLQDADGADLAQDVLREVAQSIGRFQYDPTVGRFRSWLFLITRRVLIKRFQVAKRGLIGTGDTTLLRQLNEIPADQADPAWEIEYQKQVFRWASDRVKSEFAESTWLAFWMTAVDAAKPVSVADQLGMTVGAVYVAKNRVLKRIRERISRIDDTMDFPSSADRSGPDNGPSIAWK